MFSTVVIIASFLCEGRSAEVWQGMEKIWQFGSHVFDKVGKRRTPHDLKDKWRNMCKAHSKSK